ncbi:MAG: hypothetical protein GEV09_07525 [Pseudonocardiaceae bacterium]|nr:hypothetical protein [Pseudonocardiaceae bacterium]
MRTTAVAALLAAGALGLAPTAASAGEASDHRAAAPDSEVSVLAVSLTAGGAVAAVGSGVALAVNRRRRLTPPHGGEDVTPSRTSV